jgi:hypothetical protein
MRFVVPETRKIDLPPQNGVQRWIVVKRELSKGEDAAFRTRGFRRMSQGKDKDDAPEIEIDWTALALARVEAYLVGWSCVTEKGKQIPVTREMIASLDDESFTEIDEAIQQHMKEMAEEKKARSGNQPQTVT